MVVPASIDHVGSGPTALDALAEPASLAAGWVQAGPPWLLVLLAVIAIALLWIPDRRPTPSV